MYNYCRTDSFSGPVPFSCRDHGVMTIVGARPLQILIFGVFAFQANIQPFREVASLVTSLGFHPCTHPDKLMDRSLLSLKLSIKNCLVHAIRCFPT